MTANLGQPTAPLAVAAYLNSVERECRDLDPNQCHRLLADLEIHLIEMSSHVGDFDAELGPPAEYARELRAALGLPQADPPLVCHRRSRHRSILVAAVITGSVGAAAIAAVVIYAATTTDHHTTALVPPATTTGAQTRPVTAVANGLPTDTGTAIPVSAFTVPITHTGIYSYTSPPLPITHASNAMGFGQKFIGGQVTMRMLASPSGGTGMDITETAAGKWVIEAHFDVVSYTGHPVLQFQNAFVEGTAGQ